MKKPLVILIVALIAGLIAFGIARKHCSPPSGHTLLDELPELAWLRTELALSDAQFSKVAELHAAYRPVCVEMCGRIEKSHARLEAVALKNRTTGAELQQAIADYERVRGECKLKMLEHLYQTAALMSEEQAGRYLKAVLPAALGSAGGVHSHH
ncbi:MAG TPA: periplasmic heavy metal sensor [Luteolibacter sp.]|nr:periplasmic heavy metal sensor [Luteolibacter sp.]